MSSLLKKMRGDKKGWYKVSDLVEGVEIAVPSPTGEMIWDEIVSINPVGREQVYDIEVEATHNFVGNGIFAHNTYVLRANTALAVEGTVNATNFVVPVGSQTSASTTLMAEIPPEVLTADGTGVDLYKLATYNLAGVQALAAKLDAEGVRVTALETRVEKLESGAVSSVGNVSIGTTSLASVFESLGAYISKGFAQFGTLIADRFVAAANSAGTSSAGTVSMLIGNTVAEVTNAYVTPATKIFVTFNAPVIGSWYVSDKQDGSFRVVLSAAQTTDVSFDYFLVQTEGQVATSTPEVIGNREQVIVNSTPTSNLEPPTSGVTSTTTSVASTTTSNLSPTDSTVPVVTLTGAAAMEITVGDSFTDPGATATDNVDGDLTAKIVKTGTVDTKTIGSYTLTYTATDAAKNVGTASRLVTVLAAPAVASDAAASSTPSI